MSTTIRIGHCYMAKLTKKTVAVRVEAKQPEGVWQVRSLETGRTTQIKKDAFQQELVDEADFPTEPKPNRRAQKTKVVTLEVTPEPVAKTAAPVATTKKVAKQSATKPTAQLLAPDATPKRTTLLGATHQLLTETGKELTTGQIIEGITQNGDWTTNGKTPANTLHAAINKEIAVRGEASRFRKGEARGTFAAN